MWQEPKGFASRPDSLMSGFSSALKTIVQLADGPFLPVTKVKPSLTDGNKEPPRHPITFSKPP
jgi:hypothetical protein